ncbi:MAG TPA: carboxypeptidase regulatory-like domain-containing protein [Bryobacteraceae bacterium]|nr:carboxypeptidase regulatory-like domain-containing protein [Bryobacteraceae bacterium]
MHPLLRAAACVIALCGLAAAQTVTGTLDGHVSDPGGAAVPNVKIAARNAETGFERTTVTNETGYFQLAFVPIGRYDVVAEARGFATVTAKDVEITLNKTTTVPLTLRVSSVQESVTVTDVAPLIDVTSGQVRRSLDDRLVSVLPSSRNFLGFVALFPGFQTNPTSGQNNYTLSSGSSVSFNGTGTRGTTFLTDGVSNDDQSENQNRQGVNISTIKEMQILTNNFAPEFGRGFGAVVLVQTKSGSNATHGEGYWYHQNSALNARSWPANAAGMRIDPAGRLVPNVAKASTKNHRAGGTLGGAIFRDKLFYFGSLDRFWAPGTTSLTSYVLPSEWRTPQVDPSLPDAAARRVWIQSIIDRFPKDLQPNNPNISPWAYTAPVPRSRHDHDYSGRIDWQANTNNLFYGRYQYSTFYSAVTKEIVKGENVKSDHRFQSIGLTHTHVFSPTTTGEFRFGFGRRRILVDFLEGDYPPIVRFNYPGFGPIIGNASSYPQKRYQNDFQYVYNVATQLGSKHTLKAGTDIRRTQLNDWAENYNRGFWSFGSQGGFNNMENFLRGVVNNFTIAYGPPYIGLRMLETNFYAQDDWRVAPSLTLNIGMRFEYVGEPVEVNNLYDSGYGADTYFEPRFGFAWSPRWSGGLLGRLTGGPGNTSIRGGFGMFHGRIYQSIFSQIGASTRFNPPTAATLGFSNPNQSVADPTGGFVFRPGPPTAQVSLANVDPHLHNPYTEQWNFTIERNLPWNAAFQAGYLGNRGIGLIFYNWRNRAQFPITSTQPANYTGSGLFPGVRFDKIDANLFNPSPAPGFISLQQSWTNARRPDGRYGLILEVSNGAWSYYNALQLQYTQRSRRGLTAQVGYTWSKNIDTGSEATSVGAGDINAVVSEFQGARSLRGLSRLSQPHRFTASYLYELPLWRNQKGPDGLNRYVAGLLGRAFGGWQVSGVTTYGSGNPFTVFLGYDLNGDSIVGDRPFLLDPSILGRSVDNGRTNPATGKRYSVEQLPVTAFFPDSSFVANRNWPWYPGSGIVGSLGRNTFWSHGQRNWDIAVIKNVRVYGERHNIQFRAEAFNAFNRVQFDFPAYLSVVDTSVAGWRIQPRFGEITSQRNGPRSMQMSLRYIF